MSGPGFAVLWLPEIPKLRVRQLALLYSMESEQVSEQALGLTMETGTVMASRVAGQTVRQSTRLEGILCILPRAQILT